MPLFTDTQIRAQFETRRPALVQGFANQIEWMFDEAIRRCGNTFGDWQRWKHWSKAGTETGQLVKQLMFYTLKPEGVYGRGPEYMASEVAINTERVAKDADRHADSVIDALTIKVMQKIGDLQNAELIFSSGVDFDLIGMRDGKQVEIRQQTIWNYSVKGKVFNQYPARIYVDGAFTSARKYKTMW